MKNKEMMRHLREDVKEEPGRQGRGPRRHPPEGRSDRRRGGIGTPQPGRQRARRGRE